MPSYEYGPDVELRHRNIDGGPAFAEVIAADRCPSCGADWTVPGAYRLGHQVGREVLCWACWRYHRAVTKVAPEAWLRHTADVRFTVLVVVLLVLAGCSTSVSGQGAEASASGSTSASVRATPSSEPFTLRGVLELTDSFAPATGKGGDPCGGVGGFDDLTVGAQVDVSDAGSTTVATGSVISGTLNFAGAASCILSFTAEDVPSGEGFYGVAIGSRDPLKIDEAEAKSGTVSLTIG